MTVDRLQPVVGHAVVVLLQRMLTDFNLLSDMVAVVLQ